MKILYGDKDISGYLLSYEKTIEFEKDRLIGNTPAAKVEIEVDNIDNIVNDLADENVSVYVGDKKIGTYHVYDKPENTDKRMKLTLYDNMMFFNKPYATKIAYPCTVSDQIEEMKVLSGLNIDYQNLPGELQDKEINWYDNTVNMRLYIGWIAECAGMNVFADENGNIIFRSLTPTSQHDLALNDLETYTLCDEIAINRVEFNNGLKMLECGSDENDTLYISSDNPYIYEQAEIDHIYGMYHGMSFISSTSVKIVEIPDLMLGDIYTYGNLKWIALSVKTIFHGGEYAVQEINGEFSSKEYQALSNHIGESTKIRMLRIEVNRNSNEVKILAEEQDGFKEAQAQLVLTTDKLKQLVETIDSEVEELNLSKVHRSPVPPENPEEGMPWIDISDNDNPILYVYLQIGADEDDNPIYGWVQGNDHTELQNLKRSYQELTSDSWIVEVTQQVLQSEETKELVKQSEMTAQMQALKDQISMTLEEMSGYNLLLNSTGWNDTNFWVLGTTGIVETISDNDVSDNTVSEHAFKLSNGMTLSQSVKVKQGNVYTISCAYKKYMTKAHVKVIQGDKVDYLVDIPSTDYTDEEWHEADLTFTAVSKEITVEIYASAEYLMVSDLIVNDGSVKKLWTSHNDEIYTSGVKIDKTGISIDQSDTDTTTRIDSKEFAVIDKNSGEKVLRVNRDTTGLSKLKCTDSAQIGKMLIVASEDGSRTDFVVLD